MRLLLDTHIFLWYITADPRLAEKFQAAIQDSSYDVFLSAVSAWEAVIKNNLGKLALPGTPAVYLPQQRAAHGIAAYASAVDAGARPRQKNSSAGFSASVAVESGSNSGKPKVEKRVLPVSKISMQSAAAGHATQGTEHGSGSGCWCGRSAPVTAK